MNFSTFEISASDRPQRILLASEPGVDGVFRHVEGLTAFLLSRGHEVDLAYSGRRGGSDLHALIRRVEDVGGRTLDLNVGNQPGPADVSALCRLQSFVRERQPDVIHAHSSKAGALVRMLPRVGGARILYTPHAYYGLRPGSHWQGRFYNRLERVLGHRGTTINVSESEAGFAAVVLRIKPAARTTIPNGVSLERFRPPTSAERRVARDMLEIPEGTRLLGCVARLSAQKDPHTLYRAFGAARESGANVHLAHLGTAPDTAYARKLLTGELRRHVTRLPAADPLTLYHAADALIVTSRYEGLSLVVLEALACGLPLILSNVPGNDDVLRRKPSQATAFPAGDAVAAAQCIRQWVTESPIRATNNHRELARQFYDATRNFRLVEHAYRRCGVQEKTVARAPARTVLSP